MPARDFDSIYNDYSRMVYWAAYSVVKSESDALDVSQNTFLRVFKHIKTLSGMNDAQIKSWLYRVAVNLCVDLKRKSKRETLVDETPDTAAVTSEYELPEDSFINEEQRETVRKAVDSLPDIYRECVILHFYSGLGYEEIAQLTGSTEGTVKSRMFRARERLYVILKDGECYGEA